MSYGIIQHGSYEYGPPEVAETLHHCKRCVIEFETEGDECECGETASEGELEFARCALCNDEFDAEARDSGAWFIQDSTDMTCPKCMKENE